MVGLDHIALIVSKEENLSFYEKLGFREAKRIERGYDTVVFMKCGQFLRKSCCFPSYIYMFFKKYKIIRSNKRKKKKFLQASQAFL